MLFTSVGPLRSESLISVGTPARCNIESIVCWRWVKKYITFTFCGVITTLSLKIENGTSMKLSHLQFTITTSCCYQYLGHKTARYWHKKSSLLFTHSQSHCLVPASWFHGGEHRHVKIMALAHDRIVPAKHEGRYLRTNTQCEREDRIMVKVSQ